MILYGIIEIKTVKSITTELEELEKSSVLMNLLLRKSSPHSFHRAKTFSFKTVCRCKHAPIPEILLHTCGFWIHNFIIFHINSAVLCLSKGIMVLRFFSLDFLLHLYPFFDLIHFVLLYKVIFTTAKSKELEKNFVLTNLLLRKSPSHSFYRAKTACCCKRDRIWEI